jgi:3',5'-cyclic-AMP phosphodiesterase
VIVVAHLSDTHLDGSEQRADRARRVMGYLNATPRPLDAVLVTGDIADNGLASEYEQAREILSASFPIFTCPGNHDARGVYRKVLLGSDGDEEIADDAPVNRVHRAAGAVFALCDSTIPGRDDGQLSDATLSWLDSVLAEAPDTPAFVCFHHPPVVLHYPFDGIRQFGEERLAAVIGQHPQVVAVVCGHAHTPAATTFAGRPLLVAPGVASTSVLPWERGSLVDLAAPPAVAFHVLGNDGRLTTHYRAVT